MATEQEILSFRNTVEDIRREIGKEIIGQQDVVEHMIMALVAGGNVLLEGVPGLGKTRLVRTLSHVLDLPFSRIQFTPDLMPADITGTNIIVKTTQGNAFRVPARPAVCLHRPGGRDQPRYAQNAVCPAGSHAGALRHRSGRVSPDEGALLCAGHAEPRGAGGHLPPARGAAGSLSV